MLILQNLSSYISVQFDLRISRIYIYICLFYLRFKCSYVGLCTVAPNNFVEKKFHGKVIIAKSAKKFSIFVHIEDHKSAVFSFSTFHAELPLKRNLQRH